MDMQEFEMKQNYLKFIMYIETVLKASVVL